MDREEGPEPPIRMIELGFKAKARHQRFHFVSSSVPGGEFLVLRNSNRDVTENRLVSLSCPLMPVHVVLF